MKHTTKTQTRSSIMNLLYEDLARAHSRERLEHAAAERRGRHLARAQRLARQADRAVRKAQAAKLRLARAL
jgi:hypothetical protein